MKIKIAAGRVALAWALCIFAATASATTISYDVTSLGGNQYMYDYTLSNDTLGGAIEEFTIYFDRSFYADLQLGGNVTGWDLLVIQPDLGIPDDGFFDALTLGSGVAPGDSAGGFSVIFTWLGPNLPGAQIFDVVDPLTFATLDSGVSVPAAVIPLPAPVILMLAALALLPKRKFT